MDLLFAEWLFVARVNFVEEVARHFLQRSPQALQVLQTHLHIKSINHFSAIVGQGRCNNKSSDSECEQSIYLSIYPAGYISSWLARWLTCWATALQGSSSSCSSTVRRYSARRMSAREELMLDSVLIGALAHSLMDTIRCQYPITRTYVRTTLSVRYSI